MNALGMVHANVSGTLALYKWWEEEIKYKLVVSTLTADMWCLGEMPQPFEFLTWPG